MDREILFRGIPKDDTTRHFFVDIWKDDCEGSFVYGYLIISKDRYYICVSALCQINSCINNGITSMIEIIPETIGQYTVLTDKNGKRIFEGDIVRYSIYPPSKYEYGVVNWFNGGFRAGDANCNLCVCSADGVATYKLEVIGNIHDNPELMEGENESGFNKHKA